MAGKWVSYTTCPCSGPASSSQSGLPVSEGCSRLVAVSPLPARVLHLSAVQCQTPSTNRPFGGPPPPRPCALEPDICAGKLHRGVRAARIRRGFEQQCFAWVMLPPEAEVVGSKLGIRWRLAAVTQSSDGACSPGDACSAGRAGGPAVNRIQEPAGLSAIVMLHAACCPAHTVVVRPGLIPGAQGGSARTTGQDRGSRFHRFHGSLASSHLLLAQSRISHLLGIPSTTREHVPPAQDTTVAPAAPLPCLSPGAR
jgi:hypothetical protein